MSSFLDSGIFLISSISAVFIFRILRLNYAMVGQEIDYQKKKVVGLERGPLSLVSTTEELLDRKVAAPV
jgi:hypothetical protein